MVWEGFPTFQDCILVLFHKKYEEPHKQPTAIYQEKEEQLGLLH